MNANYPIYKLKVLNCKKILSTNQLFQAFFLICLIFLGLSGYIWLIQSANSTQVGASKNLLTISNEEAISYLKESGEYDSFTKALIKSKYKVESGGQMEEYQANNQAQSLQAFFSPEGVKLSLKYENRNYVSAWKLKNIGYGEHQETVGSGMVKADGQRAEIIRAEQHLTEWFENKPEGLEHGFTLFRRPFNAGIVNDRLRLIMTVDGELSPRVSADGQLIDLIAKNGQEVMRYSGLRVWDAEGQSIKATMQTNEKEVWLDVEEETAVYPLTIDPTFVQRAKLSPSDPNYNNWFGESIALSGDTIIVGSSQTNIGEFLAAGAAYVFVRDGTTWREQAKLTANDGMREDLFGDSVAIDGDIALIGAPFADVGSDCKLGGINCDEGAAYIFVRTGTTWTQQQKIISVDPEPRELFGYKVKIQNNTAVISEHLDSTARIPNSPGKANVYSRTNNTLTLQQRLTTNDPSVQSFGWSLDLDQDTIAVGAPRRLTGGAVYVFQRNGASWVQQQKLTASDDDTAGNSFGDSVALSGDTMVVGDTFDDIDGNLNQGSAYVFTRSGNSWTQRQKLTSGVGRPLDHYGTSVGVSGGTIIVSSPSERVGVNYYQGAVYVYSYNGANWTQQQKLTAADGVENSLFGISALISNNTIVIGALNSANPGPSGEAGAVYVFQTLPARVAPFDFDGDRKTDVAVFRPSDRMWYLLRSADNGLQTFAFGLSTDKIVPADFDGDGKTDIAVFRPSDSVWYWINSSTNVFQTVQFGMNDDIPVPSDFDGDRRADITVFRPSDRTWWRINSITGSVSFNQFGLNGDIPTPADFDGDLRADIAVFRPSNGVWYRINSIDNSFFAMQFGQSGDLPAPADFDGDGIADINVYRPSEGMWYRINSEPGCVVVSKPENTAMSAENQVIPGCIIITRFGLSEDRPTVGDFNGDGRADISLFRPSNGVWYRLMSPLNDFSAIQFGINGDVPIPSAFIP